MIGVIADDTTGANDMGTMFHRNGKSVKILTYQHDLRILGDVSTDVLIVDTNSRLDRPEVCYAKVHDATQFLMREGCDRFFKKTASAFVGNVGYEFDAMLDALNTSFCIVVAAFPDTGRTTVGGIQYIDGVPLAQSEFANDPVHPMTESSISKIIQAQTDRSVGNIYLETVRQGTQALSDAIAAQQQHGVNYLVLDARTSDDLEIIASATANQSTLGGSSVMGGYMHYPATNTESLVPAFSFDNQGVLVISGSLMPQTHDQTQYLLEKGIDHIILDSRDMLDEAMRHELLVETQMKADKILASGRDLLIMPTDNPEIVQETKTLGAQLFMDTLTISKCISSFMSELAHSIVKALYLHRFVIAGGDTSGAVTRALGIQGNYVIKEIEPGIPLSLSLDRQLLYVLKSGSFGTQSFLAQAIQQVKGDAS